MAGFIGDRKIISLGDNLLIVDYDYGSVIDMPSYAISSLSVTHEIHGVTSMQFDVIAHGQIGFLNGDYSRKSLKQALGKRAILEMLDSEDLLAELHRRSADRAEVITEAKLLLPGQG